MMSDGKTIIPFDIRSRVNDPEPDSNENKEIYKPSGNVSQGTVIPSDYLNPDYPVVETSDSYSFNSPHTNEYKREITLKPRMVVGVLYSISRGLLGEILPVYLGINIIGSDGDSDIILKEATVSSNHAVIQVIKSEDTKLYEATFTDDGSDYGSSVNNADARFNTLKVNDGDILEIGKHYKLLLRLFNTSGEVLCEDEDFEDTSEPEGEEEFMINTDVTLSNELYAPTSRDTNNKKTVLR